MATSYKPLRSEDAAAAQEFLEALGTYGRTGRLSQRDLVTLMSVHTTKAGPVRRLEAALPPGRFLTFVNTHLMAPDSVAPANGTDPADIIQLYLTAYERYYSEGADAEELSRVRSCFQRLSRGQCGTPSAPLSRQASSSSPVSRAARTSRTARRLSRLSELAAAEAGRPLAAGGAGTSPLTLGDLYVPRAVEAVLRRRIAGSRVTVVTGEPGVGKTSLLWHQVGELQDAGRPWLFVRAVDLVPGRGTEGSRQLVGLDDVDELATGGLPASRLPVVLVDTVDLLWRSRAGQALLLDLLERAETWPTAVVLTCRDQEYAELARAMNARGVADRRLRLGPYADAELGEAVGRHTRHFLAGLDVDTATLRTRILHSVTRGLPLREVVARPLTLRMLFETHRDLLVHAAGPTPSDDRDGDSATSESLAALYELDISDVYDRYWELRVRADERVGVDGPPVLDAAGAAEFTALVMLSLGRPSAHRFDEVESGLSRTAAGLARLKEGLASLARRQVILEDGSGRLQFMHQTFFEYAAARALDQMSPEILDDLAARVKEHPEDLFLAAVVQQLLVRACLRSWEADAIDGFFASLLGSGEPAHRQLAVTAYALARHRGPRTIAAGRALLRLDAGLAQRYLTFVPRTRHADLSVVLADLSLIWNAHDHPKPGHASELRKNVLETMAAIAVQDERAVRRFLLNDDLHWLGWFASLHWTDAYRVRGAPLAVIEAVGHSDQQWAADQLAALAAAVVGGSAARDALAAVLAAAARILDRPADLERLISTVPDSDNHEPSGLDQLRDAVAGLLAKAWTSSGEDAVAIAERLCVTAVPWKGDLQRTLHQAQWVALAELGLRLARDRAEDLLGVLLCAHDPALQTDIAERALPRLIEGPHRALLPGSPPDEPRDGPQPACVVARRRCGAALLSLPQPAKTPGQQRAVATMCRSALDQAAVPGRVIAEILAEAFPGGPSNALWLGEDGLAALFSQAALGGHQQARVLLDAWTAGEAAASVGAEKIITHRLAKAAERSDASAWSPLLRQASRTRDTHFLRRALEHAGDRGRVVAREHLLAAAVIAMDLVQDAHQDRRGRGYDLFAELLLQSGAAPVPPEAVLRALGERQLQVVTKGLTLVERVLDQQPEQLSAPDVADEVEQALRRWTEPGGSATEKVVDRARKCLGDLFCRVVPLEGEQRTLDEARRLSLSEEADISRKGYWYLVARLAATDVTAAASEIVQASRAVHDRFGDDRSSWRQKWARAAHRAVTAVVPVLEPSAWTELVRRLAPLDQALLAVVAEVSAEQRDIDDLSLLDSLFLAGSVDTMVTERLRLVRQQRERYVGSASTWPALVRLWQQLAPGA